MPRIFSVYELTGAIKNVLAEEFPFVWVRGQVSNYSCASSGHIYFSLKDDQALLNVVWFRSSQGRMVENKGIDPLTGEVLENPLVLADGKEVLCAGRINVYGVRGAYQLVAELVQEQGAGRLQILFEELKQRLYQEGLFAQEKKQPLPKNPVRVAVITAPGSAALRDFLKLAHVRGQSGQIRVYPSLVQGTDAPAQLCAALAQVATDGWAQVVALLRGGGSLEDLWAFNDEELVRRIGSFPLPVLTGVGHEVDTSLADLVADVRAATPTHAAQLLWPQRESLAQTVDELEARLKTFMRHRLEIETQTVRRCRQALDWFRPDKQIQRAEEKVLEYTRRLSRGMDRLVADRERAVVALRGQIFSPVRNLFDVRSLELLSAQKNCARAIQDTLRQKTARAELLLERFWGLDPQKPLSRGYCLLENERGRTVSSIYDLKNEELVKISMRDGKIRARVKEREANTLSVFEEKK